LSQAYAVYGFYPPINQIELHPKWRTSEIVSFCNRHGILVEAYAPIGGRTEPHDVSDPPALALAKAYNVTPGQVLLGWALQVTD
jgi:diketogulonate reductase-like aldo/keto reductase